MTGNKKNSIIVHNLSQHQVKDSGMAFVLICLLLAAITGSKIWLPLAIIILIFNMTIWRVFYYPAVIWLSFANLLGLIMSNVLLTLIFYIIITPIGSARRLMGKFYKGGNPSKYDSMKRKLWNKSKQSAFTYKEHTFTKKDLINPY